MKQLPTREGEEGSPHLTTCRSWTGAPGSGKGTNTKFIMRERSLTAPPIVMSDLLQSPEAQAIKAAGGLVGDMDEVVEILFSTLLQPKYASGVVVDGFPRSPGQALMLKMLHDNLLQVHREGGRTGAHPRPIFRICVLFVDQDVSVGRQVPKIVLHLVSGLSQPLQPNSVSSLRE